jgi:transcriptional coactivator HFI1/ADA1
MATTVTKADLHGSPPPPSAPIRSATIQANSTPIQKPGKLPGSGAPRIDVEPIYTALKTAIGNDWPLYKLTIAEFALGMLRY